MNTKRRFPIDLRNILLIPVLLAAVVSCQKPAVPDSGNHPAGTGPQASSPETVRTITSAVEAFTTSGDGVVLDPDGTWKLSGRRGVFEVDTNGITSYRDVPVDKLLRAKVLEVYDGDTLTIEIQDPPPGIGKQERIRLLGIDTPELDAAGSTPEGKAAWAYPAKDFTTGLSLDKTVYLAFESAWRDKFSRLLCYVWLEDGSLLNARILSGGFAAVFTDIRCAFQEEFMTLEAESRKAGLGIWKRSDSDGIIISTIHNEGTEEFIELINRSNQVLNVSGWKIEDASGNTLVIPNAVLLPPGGVFRIHSGSGSFTEGRELIHPTTKQLWNNGGDTAKLFSGAGALVDEYSY